MSNNENTIFYEETKQRFDDMVAESDWAEIMALGVELEEKGFGALEIELHETLTAEQVTKYKAWDTKVNGDEETQQDDDSDKKVLGEGEDRDYYL